MATGKFELGDLKFAAFGDRVLVEEDEFKSGYECPKCNAIGKVKCDNCEDGVVAGKFKCAHCEGEGKVTCPECKGKGGLLVVADESKRRPTTGRIVSIGDKVEHLTVGMSVLYSSYAGHTVDLNRAGVAKVMRVLHEPEVLCEVEGHLTLRQVRGKSEIATFS